jgi:hypothetical protein
MTEFIQEKRKLFVMQLLIDRKQKSILQIEEDIRQETADLEKLEAELEVSRAESERRNSHLRSESLRMAKSVEAAVANRSCKEGKLKLMAFSVASLRSKIGEKRVRVESMRLMQEFLMRVGPNGQGLIGFVSPYQLIDEMNHFEEDNLWIAETIAHYQGTLAHSLGALERRLERNIASEKEMMTRLDCLDDIPEMYLWSPTADEQDSELARLGALVERAHGACFHKRSSASTHSQLAHIETELEKMFRQLELISPRFIQRRRIAQAKARREGAKIEIEKQKAEQQRTKIAQALERDNKEAKQKDGRPLVRRTQPPQRKERRDAALEMIRRERAYMEKLLYGEIFD